MGINAALPEGHNSFGERQPRGFNPGSREVPNPGKGRLRLVEGHIAISLQQEEADGTEEQPKFVKESPQAIVSVQEPSDFGYSEVEIALRTPPPEYQFRVGDVF